MYVLGGVRRVGMPDPCVNRLSDMGYNICGRSCRQVSSVINSLRKCTVHPILFISFGALFNPPAVSGLGSGEDDVKRDVFVSSPELTFSSTKSFSQAPAN